METQQTRTRTRRHKRDNRLTLLVTCDSRTTCQDQGFHFPFATSGTYESSPRGGKSRVLPLAAQGLIAFVTLGVGLFIGSWVSRRLVDAYAIVGPNGVTTHDWRSIWLVPAAGAAVIMIIFAILFRPRGTPGGGEVAR